MAKNKGFFTVERAFLDTSLWLSEPFTRGQAWLDLIGLANYEATEEWRGARSVQIPRGAILTTCRELAERWGWSRTKAWRFICELKANGMVNATRNNGETMITIENYGKYQTRRNSERNNPETNEKQTGNKPETSSYYINKLTNKQINKENGERGYIDAKTGVERIIIKP